MSGKPFSVTSEQPVLDLGDLSGATQDSTDQRQQTREKIRSQRISARQAAIDRSGAAPGAHYFGWLYLVAWAAGTFPLFADPNHRLWFIPWIVMLAYGLVGHAKAEQTGTMFEFADSVYYLGFTLSVGALLASLDPFNPNAKPDAERLFRLFGLALITTLFGVVGRTALQTFYRLPSETIEEVNQRLTAEARRYVDRLSEFTASMDRILTTQVQTTEAKLVPQFATLENVLRMTVADLTVISGGAQALKETVKDAAAALGVMTEQYQARSRDITASHDSIVSSANELSSALSGASDSTVASVSQFSDAVEILDQHTKSVSSALEKVATDLERAQSAHSDLTGRDFTAALDLFAQQLDALSDATANQRKLTEGEVEMLQTQVTTTLAAARDVSAALEEITTLVLARLQQLTAATNG
ncbi:MAG: apolipoprotein A1/A4/E family protein [Gemmatimonadota bacterium]|nr:apolipoprotein A1/A4/E family protein [Gemmatimonadota bacterium]